MKIKVALFVIGMAVLQFLAYYFSELRPIYALVGGLVSTFFVSTIVSTLIGTYVERATGNIYKNKYYVINFFRWHISISAFMVLTFMATVVSVTVIYYFSDVDSYLLDVYNYLNQSDLL
ncbi:hypothetical protein [Methanolapillus africanus]